MFKAEIKSKAEEDISILISLDNHPWQYICDCGKASGFAIREYQNTNAIFISHTHFDHFIDFDQIFRHQIGLGRKVTICGPQGIAQQVQNKIQSYTWNLIESDAITYEIREIISEQEIKVFLIKPPSWDLIPQENLNSKKIFKTDDFEVRFTILDHKTDSIAYRFDQFETLSIDLEKSQFEGGPWIRQLKEAFQKDDKDLLLTIQEESIRAADLFHLLHKKKGSSLGIILDHAANESNHLKIESLFSNTDLVLVESFFLEADQELAALHFHSYSTASGKLMKKIGVKKAIPIHFSRKYKGEDVEKLKSEFNLAFN